MMIIIIFYDTRRNIHMRLVVMIDRRKINDLQYLPRDRFPKCSISGTSGLLGTSYVASAERGAQTLRARQNVHLK